MNDAIVYRPYKSQTWPLVFTIPAGILAFVGAGYCLTFSVVSVLCLIGAGMACVWLTKVLYDSSKRAAIFEQNGIRIIGSYFDYRYIPWGELTYGCYARNYKGHLFLLLSPNVLNSEEAKRFANKGANSSRIVIDHVVVIYLDVLQDVAQIKSLIEGHLDQVDTY
jgi:hypothetical protein